IGVTELSYQPILQQHVHTVITNCGQPMMTSEEKVDASSEQVIKAFTLHYSPGPSKVGERSRACSPDIP
ncbi:Hypothetical predicted protein, partial [Pelobates cultripes]